MLMEIYHNPGIAQAGRINAVLDHVYGNSQGTTNEQRNRSTLQLLLEKLDGYERQMNSSQMPDMSFNLDVGAMTPSESFPIYDPWAPQPTIGFGWGPLMNFSSYNTSAWV